MLQVRLWASRPVAGTWATVVDSVDASVPRRTIGRSEAVVLVGTLEPVGEARTITQSRPRQGLEVVVVEARE